MVANLTLPATMRALLLTGLYNVTVQDVAVPKLVSPTEAIVKLTTSGICGSDLYAYRGFSTDQDPYVLGHECIGYVVQTGSGVSGLSIGDYVVIPDNFHHGQLEMQPTFPVSYGGGVQSLGVSGLQAEYAIVNAADANLFRLPIHRNETNESLEQSYLMTGDIFSTGWTAITCALLRGASRVYTVDHVQERLDVAKSIGAVPINFAKSDPVAEIQKLKPAGVERAVDCVGLEALNSSLSFEPSIIIRQMVNVTGFEGGLGQIGVHAYTPGTQAALGHPQLSADITFPATSFWTKLLRLQAGIVQPYRIAPQPNLKWRRKYELYNDGSD
ncbi:alcohol dehydrogenase like domain-containing protein [Fusarium phyllophilum]|uniref:Alcohol dehydrogenase like domain-containing protein n=1 Tax=Fusarium phyllophilum TaxID=47803 RepID=A0A8H5J3V1_9HYPO|nr:alcohol dehydrogenase like domain-containing protein [Fusarium phyllophilum]